MFFRNAGWLAILFVVSSISPSWARFHRGYPRGGVSVHVGLGAWYPYYPYGPYYPYYSYPAYLVQPPIYNYPSAANSSPQKESSIKDDAHYDPKTIDDEVGKIRSFLDYQFQDGDISRAEHDGEMIRIDQIVRQSHTEADTNGGYLTGVQLKTFLKQLQGDSSINSLSPSTNPPAKSSEIMIPDIEAMQGQSPQDYGKMLADFHAQLKNQRTLLKRQLTKGGITQTQYENNMKALDKLAEDEHQKAAENNGSLSADQIVDLTHQLGQIQEQIQKDLSE